MCRRRNDRDFETRDKVNDRWFRIYGNTALFMAIRKLTGRVVLFFILKMRNGMMMLIPGTLGKGDVALFHLTGGLTDPRLNKERLRTLWDELAG